MRILAAIALFALWLVLSATLHPAHVALGAVVACFVAWIAPPGPPMQRRVSLPAAVAYVPWLLLRVLKSGLHVSLLILNPRLPISPRLIHHKTELTSDGEIVVLGNSITLTPGTVTVEAKPGELVVHALDAESSKGLESGDFDAKVGTVFRLKEG
ncbi:MAG: Na+/H+ antiporter subunit E [Gammaproteobacteria bacterium]